MDSVQILYHGTQMEQLINNVTKRLILDKIFDCIKLKVLDKTADYCGHMSDPFWKNPIIMTLKTSGERCWLYFTRIDALPRIFLIPNHIRIGYPYPKIFHLTNCLSVQGDEGIYENTLLECEILGTESVSVPLHIVIADILIHKGKDMQMVNPCVRFSTVVNLLKSVSSGNESVIKIQFKQLFSNRELKKLIKFTKKLDYKVNGIFFYSCSSSDEVLKPRLYFDRSQEMYIDMWTTSKKK
jgi:hypothetical protein